MSALWQRPFHECGTQPSPGVWAANFKAVRSRVLFGSTAAAALQICASVRIEIHVLHKRHGTLLVLRLPEHAGEGKHVDVVLDRPVVGVGGLEAAHEPAKLII